MIDQWKENWQLTKDEMLEYVMHEIIKYRYNIPYVISSYVRQNGKFIQRYVGTRNAYKIIEYYKNKYKLYKLGLHVKKPRSDKHFRCGYNTSNNKLYLELHNNKKLKDSEIGVIRHEIEHAIDFLIRKYKPKVIVRSSNMIAQRIRKCKKEYKGIQEIIKNSIGHHHMMYDMFDVEYYHKHLVKAAMFQRGDVPVDVIKCYPDLYKLYIDSFKRATN